MTTHYQDAIGRNHEVAPTARIVSLVPSLTELLFDLGLAGNLVGRTQFCVHPKPAIDAVPSVGGTKKIDMDVLRGLDPSHVLVNIDENPKEMADDLSALGLGVVVTHPLTVADNRELFQLIGGLFGAATVAERLVGEFDAALAALVAQAQTWSERRVLYLIWRKPWMTIATDTYIADMLALAGLKTIDTGSPDRYPEIALDTALLEKVDDVLFSTEPFPFTEKHLDAFRAEFPEHAAKARLIDAEMVSWYGSRAVPGLRYLTDFRNDFAP